jgi:beta-glucanase (GH16 family)
MKGTLTSLLGGALLLLGASQPIQAQTYQQVWADEFNGTAVNTSNWVFETGGGGWGNNEKQYYQAANATVANGELVITARKQSVGGMPYTSARMKTQGLKQFTYGRMEARIKVPLGQGLWPAFWMLGSNINTVSWPGCGEIDIMEQINADSRCYGTVHWDSNGHAQYGQSVATSANTYHVYSIEWTPTYIRWFVDGAKYNEINITNGTGSTEEFQRPFFLLLNMAVAGDWPGQTVDESKLPATMNVDYVRVYQLTSGSTGSGSVRTFQAEAANVNSGMTAETTSDTGGGQDMGYVDANDYLVFNSVNFPVTGAYTISYRVASPSGGTVSSDLNAGSIQLGNTAIPATGGWQTWTTVSKTVNINAGTYNLGVFAQTGGWNINWISITNPAGARMALTPSTAASPSVAGLYPNPVAGSQFLRTEPEIVGHAYQVLDAVGRVASQGTVGVDGLDVSALRAGQYTLLLTSPTQERSSRHFTKQ